METCVKILAKLVITQHSSVNKQKLDKFAAIWLKPLPLSLRKKLTISIIFLLPANS